MLFFHLFQLFLIILHCPQDLIFRVELTGWFSGGSTKGSTGVGSNAVFVDLFLDLISLLSLLGSGMVFAPVSIGGSQFVGFNSGKASSNRSVSYLFFNGI